MSIFSINYSKLINRLIPSFLKGENFLLWVKSFSKPIETLKSNFDSFRTSVRSELSFNSGTMVFELFLNEKFDSTLKRIYIVNQTEYFDPLFINEIQENEENPFIYEIQENQPSTFIYNISEFQDSIDFFVYVPNELNSKNNEIVASINLVKLAGKTFQIIYF